MTQRLGPVGRTARYRVETNISSTDEEFSPLERVHPRVGGEESEYAIDQVVLGLGEQEERM